MIKLIFVMVLMFGCWQPGGVEAAKARNWTAATKTTTNSGGSTPWVRAKLTKWKQYVNLTMGGLSKAESVDYELTYTGNGMEQGVWGTIKGGANASREMFMGTCSHGACVAHKNISGVRLALTYKMKDGSTISKRYKVKY